MYKTKNLIIMAFAVISIITLAVFSLTLWGSRSDAEEFYQAPMAGGALRDSDTFQASWLIGRHLMSTDKIGDIGQISDVLFDRCGGRAAFVVLSDTPDLGGEKIAVPFDSLVRTGEQTFQLSFGDRKVPVSGDYMSSYNGVGFQDQYSQFLEMNRDFIRVRANQSLDSQWAEGVYKVYGLAPYWTEGTTSQPEFTSYIANRTSGDPLIHYPGGRVVASSGASPFWASCGSCGAEAVNFEALAEPALPSFAKPGECYARVYIPSRCETVTEQVMTRAASERVESIPAKYEAVEERVMVTPASKKIEEVPAEYKTVEEKVLVEPAHSEWRPGRGAVEKMDPTTGKIMCFVEVPATYKTVQKQVLVKEATTREVEIPAQYEMRKVDKMVEPAHENHIQIPAEYNTVTKNEKVADGYWEWQKVEGCHAD